MSHSLPVLDSSVDSHRIARELSQHVRGEVRFDRHNRLLYSTDASLYQSEPIGVVLPIDADDVAAVLAYCYQNRVPVLPRGGGTSLAGQCTNRAVVVDFSAMCRRILSVDTKQRLCKVEPGISINELNRELAPLTANLLFAPDPATVAQATVGGCIGNNAAGARSIRYGRTSENLAGVDVLLSDGRRCTLKNGAGRTDAVALRLAREVSALVLQYAELIRARFPKLVRRNAGYGLDLVLQQLDRGICAEDLDLSGLICGSEGTLALVIGAELKLHSVPKVSGLAIASFASLEAAIAAVPTIVATGATAVELIDEVVLEAAANNSQCRTYLELMPTIDRALPKAVLYVEYQSDDSVAVVEERFDALRAAVPAAPVLTYLDAKRMGDAWTLRKSGEALLHSLGGSRKPHTFVEDNSVPLENLGRFVEGFKEVVTRHGTRAAYWAHASVGVLHVRPLIDLHTPADRQKMQAIAVEVADLARDCGGVMSGEHGDGRVRGPLLERFYGSELMTAFAELKHIFDPAGILNPGMIVGAGAIKTITESLRVDQGNPIEKVDTFFDYSDQEDFSGAVEMCNGSGFCRKTVGGTMCPSYRATLDERHSTRGRGNALRLAISGQLGGAMWNDPGVIETLDLCLSCKACKSECPSNVDMARLKAEYTGQRFRVTGATLAAKMFGHVRKLNRMGAKFPELSNWMVEQPFVKQVMGDLLGIAKKRAFPAFSESLYRLFVARAARPCLRNQDTGRPDVPRVALYADCFTTYNDSHIGISTVNVLERLGYRVELPRVGCCGRSMLSTGLIADAIASADRVLGALSPLIDDENVRAIVVCEPSCLSAIKDDWLQLKLSTPMDVRKRLAAKAFLPEEFIERFWNKHPAPIKETPFSGQVLLHGHCHQKALWGDATSADLLHRLAPGNVTVMPSGCCGMAGSFGYQASKFDLSMKIGELSVFGPVRAADQMTVIAAPGTSCRAQIRDGTGREVVHPMELVEHILCG